MTAFNPRKSAEILEAGPLKRLGDEIAEEGFYIYRLIASGYPSWHRLVREAESRKDALWDRYWFLREQIEWLYRWADRRLADIGMSR